MKKTLSFLLLSIMMLVMFAPSFADDYESTLTGTTETHNKEMVMIDVHINGSGINNIKGDVNFSSNDLAIFSIEKNEELSDWDLEFNTSSPTKISFSGSSASDINGDTVLFTVKFVVFNERTTFTNVTTTNVQSVMRVVERIITNQDQIDEAQRNKDNAMTEEMAESIVIPDPIYREQVNEYMQNFTDANIDINVTAKLSENCYLKSVEVRNGTLTPAFNKLTNSYKIEVTKKNEPVDITALAELDSSTVEIGKELNGQIVVTVIAEDESVNSYVFKIERSGNNNPAGPGSDTHDNPNKLNGMTIAILAGLGVIAAGFIGIGGYYVYQGSRDE